MKTVIFNVEKSNTILYHQLTADHIIGIQDECGSKGFMTRSDYCSGKFMLMCTRGIHTGNYYSQHFDSLGELIAYFKKSALKVFVFDNETELFKWLAQ